MWHKLSSTAVKPQASAIAATSTAQGAANFFLPAGFPPSRRLIKNRALLVTLATFEILFFTSNFTSPSTSLNPSRHVYSFVKAALTHVFAFPICSRKARRSLPQGRCRRTLKVLLSSSTESPIWSTQSFTAARCRLDACRRASERYRERSRARERLTEMAAWARSCDVLTAPP